MAELWSEQCANCGYEPLSLADSDRHLLECPGDPANWMLRGTE